jgi:iron complex outermembrane receptor protein
MLQPEIERKGISGRLTFNIGDNHQLYAMGNWYTTKSFASFTPLGFNGTPTPPIPATLTAYNVMLPIYVCPTGVGTPTGLNTGCDALTPGSILNPYNPFATGDPLTDDTAQMFIRSTRPRTVETKSRALRGALGVSGSFWNDVRYNVEATASQVQLDRTQSGYFIPQRIMNLVARGAFNFFDIESNSEELWDYISPDQTVRSVSDLWQVSGTLAKDLLELPGGPLQAAVGLSYRHESINAPSANPAINNELGVPDPLANQYERYYSINSVEAVGSRNVKSAFFEVGAPILDQLEVNLSGRFDKYSTGQSNFSPKIGAKFTPIKELAIRGTFSKGFRIPSFNEAFGLPTTGYVGRGGTSFCDDGAHAAFCAAHANNTYATTGFPLGLTQVGNPALEPEKSTAFTAGFVFEPVRNVAFTVDFWNIKVKDLISGLVDSSPIFEAYYANNGVVTGFPGITVLPGQPDPAFPNALPHIGFIQSPFQNQGSQVTRGIDFGVNARTNITDDVRWISSADASYMLKFELRDADGNKFRYDGTLSPCNITSCSGAPKWRFSWQNSFEFGDTTLTGTLYYTSGYDNASIDFGGIKGDCEASIGGSVVAYPDGTPVRCKAKPTWNFDFTANQKINDKLSVYMNVLNLFDIDAPFDPSGAYSLFQFNPAWAGPNIMGRYFRVGAKVDF